MLTNSQKDLNNESADVEKRITELIYCSGHNVIADNEFSDLKIAKELKQKKKFLHRFFEKAK